MIRGLLAAAALTALALPRPATAAVAVSCAVPSELVRLQSQLPRTTLRLTQHQPLHVVALGSSSTAGTGASAPDRTYPSQLISELRRRLPSDAIDIVNKGVGGETSVDMLARFDRDVLALHPDLVIWQVGTNAVLKGEDLSRDLAVVRAGVERLKAAAIDVILMDMQYAPRVLDHADYPVIETGIAVIAKEEGVSVFHRFEIMRHWLLGRQLSFATMLSPDQLHLNDASYGCIGRLLATAIVQRTAAPVLTSHR
jgi:acyl-CoA thioesterase I